MKIKTSELTGAALDWAVGAAEGDKDRAWLLYCLKKGAYSPSTDWAQGGPIIEREGATLLRYATGRPGDWSWFATTGRNDAQQVGPTPLIAAMRCFVAMRLGDEVEIPEELK